MTVFFGFGADPIAIFEVDAKIFHRFSSKFMAKLFFNFGGQS